MPLPVADFDVLKTLYAGRDIIVLNVHGTITGVTAVATSDVFTKTAHGLLNDQQVEFISGTGFTGLTAGATAFVIDKTDDTFKLSLTKGGAALDITADGSAGVFARATIFAAEEVDAGGNQTKAELKLPGTDGVVRVARSALKEETEEYTYPTPEVRRLLEIFDGKLKGRKVGHCTIYAPDIDDVAGTVALKSSRFACDVVRDGSTKLGGGDFSKATIKITSNATSAVTWSANATI